MRRAFLAIAAVAVMLAATAGSTLADAPRNAHNCTGSFSSAAPPASTSFLTFAPIVKGQAQSWPHDDFARGSTEASSNCSANI